MPENKTKYTHASVTEFIERLPTERQQIDSTHLIKTMSKISGEEPKLFGESIIGFGKYRYKYPTGHEGEAPLIAFSPRKAAISLYVYTGCDTQPELLKNLGKFKMGKACIYIKTVTDIDMEVLTQLMESTIDFLCKNHKRIED